MNQELQIKIQNKSFQMFRDWTANAKMQYPDYDFTIINETNLVNDLSSCLQSSVNALKKEEKASKREIPGYDIGFVWGFIQSNLNGRWVHEYIRKRSNDYKMFMTLKALQIYLDIDDIALIKTDEIYKRMFLEDVNFENIYFKPDKNKFSGFWSDLNINIITKRENNISISLDNMITEKIVKIVKEKETYFLPETEKYFSDNEVMIFISEL